MDVALGVLLPTREALLAGRPATAVVDLAVRAEAIGFASAWVGDSLVARPRFEPLTVLAAVAARTSRLTVGTAVILPALRDPLLLAHAIATLDHLAGGRLVVGVGAGAAVQATEDEFAAVGIPYGERIARLYETVALWRALWDGPVERFDGRFWQHEGLALEPRPHQPGGPPVWIAREGPKTLERAGAGFHGWLPFSATPEGFAAGLAVVRKASADAGRDPAAVTAAAYLTVTVDDDEGRAAEEQRAFMEQYYGVPYDFMRAFQGCAAGSVDTVAGWLRAYVEGGAEHIVLRFGSGDPETQLERVAPLLAALE